MFYVCFFFIILSGYSGIERRFKKGSQIVLEKLLLNSWSEIAKDYA